jgi:hypothetical protein
MRHNFDVNNVISAFLTEQYPERANLIAEIGAAMRQQSRPVQLLAAQVAHECLEQPFCTPEMTVRIGLMYGTVLGILMERDRMASKVLA